MIVVKSIYQINILIQKKILQEIVEIFSIREGDYIIDKKTFSVVIGVISLRNYEDPKVKRIIWLIV